MKKMVIVLAALLMLLTACSEKKEPAQYIQAVLPEPDRIVVDTQGTDITYEPGSANYQKLYSTLSANWWLTGETGEDLVPVTSLKDLKTTSDGTMRHTVGDVVLFLYEKEPLPWDVTVEEQLSIHTIGFVIPEEKESDIPVKGYYLISQTESIGYNEGLYTYYYSPELTNDFWSFLNDNS